MNSTIMATAPATNAVNVMDQQSQPKNMYIRYKNQVDEKVSSIQFNNFNTLILI